MEYLVTAQEMKRADDYTIQKIGIPSMVLMERAALSVFEEIEQRFGTKQPEEKKTLVVAGCGNNGADGLALARLLSEQNYPVEVAFCGNQDNVSSQWREQFSILKNYPVKTGSKIPDGEYNILIDALFGVGLSREVSGGYLEWMKFLNDSAGFKIAVDLPSGIHSDDGRVMGYAVKADLTITFAYAKRGLLLYPGAYYAGEVIVKDIGISLRSFAGILPGMFRLTGKASSLLPQRLSWGNKGSFGKILLAAGSENMAGAAVLAARSAYRIGAGMVKVISSRCNREVVHTMVPEALFGSEEALAQGLFWADVLAVGPGLGIDEKAVLMLADCLKKSSLPLIIDADGLNLLAADPQMQELIKEQGAGGRSIILTPHIGELSRLTGEKVLYLKENLAEAAQKLADKWNCVIVSKDARTCICKTGRPVCLNTTGNSGMATAGAGDALTGIIAGLLAQGMTDYEAACKGVCLHGMAGDAAARRHGKHAVMAVDIVEALGWLDAAGSENHTGW